MTGDLGYVVIYTTTDRGDWVRLWGTAVHPTAAAAAAAITNALIKFSAAYYRLQIVALTPFHTPVATAEQDELAAVREQLRGNAFGSG